MNEWKLGYDGYVMEYMTAGPWEEEYSSQTRAASQLELEARLRQEIVTQKCDRLKVQVRLGETAENGCPWQVRVSGDNCMVDCSRFYPSLKRIRLLIAACLIAEAPMQVKVRIWSYMAAGIYCNGKLEGEITRPVYKPIQHLDLELSLKAGRNLIFCDCENLGVRDTRNILGIQILEGGEMLSVGMADEACQEEVLKASAFLRGLRLEGDCLLMPEQAGEGTELCLCRESPDYEVMCRPEIWESLEGMRTLQIPKEYALIRIRIRRKGYELSRTLELEQRRRPVYPSLNLTASENRKRVFSEIAGVGSLNRGEFGFSIFNILARRELGIQDPKDEERLLKDLELIEKRVDCADFLLCGLIRYLHLYKPDGALKERIRQVLLNFRYWMDMEGSDAMCFWSENHSLMFYASAMEAGKLFPEEDFLRAGMKGKELERFGRDRLCQWLQDAQEQGFEEFLSGVYMCVTFAALLNVVDFAEEELSSRARELTDRLVRQLCLGSFKGCVIAPMGRVYRGVLHPFSQGTQALLNLIDPDAPAAYGEGWMAFLSGSSYHFPEGLKELMETGGEYRYVTGNAAVVLEKNEDYCLTSVESPRQGEWKRWENIRQAAGDQQNTHLFTKSLNECFHGTSCFAPGVYGYQQHMWYGALSGEAVIFANHPGSWSEESDMRPGYWYGNGVMPALKQEKGVLGAIYQIPDDHPVHFTHVYCPEGRFDRVIAEERWIFLQKDGGYLGLWCSRKLEPCDSMIFGCELRAWGSDTAYLCLCGRSSERGSLESFAAWARAWEPEYSEADGCLKAADPENGRKFMLQYEAERDDTQYLL